MLRKGNPCTLLAGMYPDTAIMKTVWRFLRKLKILLSYDSVIPLLGMYPKEMKPLSGEIPALLHSLQHFPQ